MKVGMRHPEGRPFPAEQIEWRTVDSRAIAQIGWDKNRHMWVHYKRGGLYVYNGVSRQRVAACLRASSIGQYVALKIKPNYPSVRVPGPTPS